MATNESIPSSSTTKASTAHVQQATVPTAPVTAASSAPAFESPILEQTAPFDNTPDPQALLGPPGKYRVLHGTVVLAGPTGERLSAFPGALINLSAEDAGPLLKAGTIRLDSAVTARELDDLKKRS